MSLSPRSSRRARVVAFAISTPLPWALAAWVGAAALGCAWPGAQAPAPAPAPSATRRPERAPAAPSAPAEEGVRQAPRPPAPRQPGREERLAGVIVVGSDEVPPHALTLPGGLARPRGIERGFDRASGYLSPCVHEFVQREPEEARGVLGEALVRYSATCTPERVVLELPRRGRVPPQRSHLGLRGTLDHARCDLMLRAAYRGAPLDVEVITLIADGERWTSPRIAVEREEGWEIASVPLTRGLARVVRRALEARELVVRFEGPRGYEDVVIEGELRHELGAMLDALDAINRP